MERFGLWEAILDEGAGNGLGGCQTAPRPLRKEDITVFCFTLVLEDNSVWSCERHVHMSAYKTSSVRYLLVMLITDVIICGVPSFKQPDSLRRRESRWQASEAQWEKGWQRSRARDKKQRRHFFVGRATWKFCSGGDKMGNASGHHMQSENEQQWKKSEWEHVQHFLHKTCN